MQFKARGKLDDGSAFNIRLPQAQNFMQAFAGVGKLLGDKLGQRAGAIVKLTIGAEEVEETFKLRDKSKGKDAKAATTKSAR
jgi:hypothetical protein